MSVKRYNAKDVRVAFNGVELEGFTQLPASEEAIPLKPRRASAEFTMSLDPASRESFTAFSKAIRHAPEFTVSREEIERARDAWEDRFPAMAEFRKAMDAKALEAARPVEPFTLDVSAFRVERIQAVVRRTWSPELHGPPHGEALRWAEARPRMAYRWECLVVMTVRHVDDDSTVELTQVEHHPYSPEDLEDPRQLRKWARHCVRKLLEHELDECLRADGELVTDPHPEVQGYRERRDQAYRERRGRGAGGVWDRQYLGQRVQFVVDDPEDSRD